MSYILNLYPNFVKDDPSRLILRLISNIALLMLDNIYLIIKLIEI